MTAPPLLLDKPLYNILLPRTTSILIDWWVLYDAEPVKIQDVLKSESCVLTSFISIPFIFFSEFLGIRLPDILDFDWFCSGVTLDYQPLFGKWARAREQRKSSPTSSPGSSRFPTNAIFENEKTLGTRLKSSLQWGMKTMEAAKTYRTPRVKTPTPFSFSLSATSQPSTGTDH